MKSIFNLVKVAFFLLLEAPIRPRWAFYRLRGFYYGYYKNRFHDKRISEYQSRLQPLHEALAFCTDRSTDEAIEAGRSEILEKMRVQHRWVVSLPGEGQPAAAGDGPIEIRYGPSPELMKAVHIVCRLLKPRIVIETGVAKGFTSASILDALEKNGQGELYSVEMPSLHIGYTRQVGEKIPDPLRKRWHLELGPSAVVLPGLLERLGSVDVFVYDSAASYDNQLTEFSIILTGMRPGGVLIADLLMTDAFIEVAEGCNCKWTTTEQTKLYPIGLLTKLA